MMSEKSKSPRDVFVVHGRNEPLRVAMFEFLRSINLSPIEWTQAVAMTGHGSPYIGQVLDTAFDNAQAIVVLVTPDEVAYLQPRHGSGDDDPQIQPAAQARPNVLFEAGMALGRDAERTVMVEIGEIRPFSDVAGRHVVRLNNSTESRQALGSRLETAGCDVNLTGTDWHSAGDFSPPEPPGGGLPLGRRVPSSSRSRPLVEFDLKFVDKGGTRIDKLQVINRGTENVYGVSISFPEDSPLSPIGQSEIEKIPGGGKSVTLDVMNGSRGMRVGSSQQAFDVTVEGRMEDGDVISQAIFIDLNG